MDLQVVVTGVGIISSLEAGFQEFADALYRGEARPTFSQVLADLQEDEAVFEVRDFDPSQWLGKKGLRVLDRSSRLLSVATFMCLEESALRSGREESEVELGLTCGTMFGSVSSITAFDWSGLEDGPRYVNPMIFPNTVINSPAGQAAIRHRLKGANSTLSAGQASGLYALHYAADSIRLGRETATLAGGVEELSTECYLGFEKNGWLSPTGSLIPFGGDGTLLGEGSAILALEDLETARSRGVSMLGQIHGFGASNDRRPDGQTNASGRGAVESIRAALEWSRIAPEDIGLIVSGASGHPGGDRLEVNALRKVFGKRLSDIPLCAPKASLGETLGAGGAFGTVAALIGLQRKEAPPTPAAQPHPDLKLSPEAQPLGGEFALVTSFGCDGSNAALVVGT